MAKIRGEDVRQDDLYVLGKGRKSATLPTHPVVWSLAQEYPRAGYWFPHQRIPGHPVGPVSVSRQVTQLFGPLGIEGSSHRCRHTFATNLLRNGVNIRIVQTLMRHDSLATTAAYLHVTDSEQTLAIASLVA